MIPTEAVERIKDALPISQVVGRRVKLKRAGRIWKGLCPWHTEKTPSFTCDDPRGTFKCFGCGEGGDVIEFARKAWGWSFNEAVAELAREAGIDLPKASPEAIAKEAKRLSLIEVNELAREWYREELTRSGEAKAWLKTRGVTNEQIEAFSIGFASGPRSGLKGALAERCGLDALSQAGLVVAGEDIAVSYDRFRDRVMFPIRDHKGRTVGFSGRLIGHGDAAKYINTPETEIFHKGSILYNADRARQPAHEGAPLIVVEGQMDVVSCVGAGFPATVAPMGTALTPDHVKGLWRLSDVPVICFDGDAAGQRAAGKAMMTAFPLLVPGRSLRFAWMPQGSDPDDLVRGRGRESLKAVLEASEGLADAFWRVSTAGKDLTTPDGKGALEAEMVEAFKAIPDDQLRRKYVDDAKQRIRALAKPRPVIRSNGHSHHSTNPGAIKLVHGLPPAGRFTLKEAAVLANLIRARDVEEAEPRGLSERTRQTISEIHHLIAALPEEEFLAALKGRVGEAISEAFEILHGAGISDYDIEGLA